MDLKNKIIIGVVIAIAIGLFIWVVPKYSGPEENVIYIGEEVNLHDEYLVTVDSIEEMSSINVLNNEGDTELFLINGVDTHFIVVTITLKRQSISNPKENHDLDRNDFKLKDHTGFQIKNIYFQSVTDGTVLSEADFDTISAYEDFDWIGIEVNSGEEVTITICFEISNNLSVFEDLMILEIDFFWFLGNDNGVDIALAEKPIN